jgi:hypothetical protein
MTGPLPRPKPSLAHPPPMYPARSPLGKLY